MTSSTSPDSTTVDDATRASPNPSSSSRHPATAALPPIVERVDEWYYFDDFDPTADLLMVLDPQSIGQPDVNPNPVSWTRRVGRGRLFYTALGHTTESYSEPFFLRHVAGGLDWVIARRR